MANKMLIDASHPEETRVVVLRGNRVEEFDFESATKKPLRGNIYLAKVTRVEPSLQAAFVDYGGNRHGFLAFSEIHPDYYQIPVSDRQALIDEEAQHRDEEDDESQIGLRRSRRHRRNGQGDEQVEKRRFNDDEILTGVQEGDLDAAEAVIFSGAESAPDLEAAHETEPLLPFEPMPPAQAVAPAEVPAPLAESEPSLMAANDDDSAAGVESAASDIASEEGTIALPGLHRLATDPEGFAVVEDQDEMAEAGEAALAAQEEELEARFRPERRSEEEEDEEADQVEQIGGDAMEEVPMRTHRIRRQYKIQEVIKRRQVLLVQVVKEERGNKGAALTTYLSLAGRYCVLMPNTARGGGISRKITDVNDRQRLKAIAQELEVPEGMGVILRTAGASRTKAEVKRDFEYLLRMWETVREMTLKSTAPTLVYEEGSLVKRAIRDLYNKDIDEVIVSGENAYREAKEFMRMLMPSHAKNVQPYRDATPIFAKSGVEAQLDAMFSNHVPLKSGGYLVINQAEALVAIDVNSGRATREHNIEDTALRTNLEAADEVARQLRLRDLAGLIVVDFIDMEESRNNRAVERRLKEALKNDRARIQIGRISHFGLLEMSRQRIRTGVLEGSTTVCPHCAGSGTVRSTASIALHVLRVLEDALIKSSAHNITMRTRSEVALYILNQKRTNLTDLEQRFGVCITITADDSLTGTAYHAMERGEPAPGIPEPARQQAPRMIAAPSAEEGFEEEAEAAEPEADAGAEESEQGDSSRRRRKRRRRRGRESTGISANAPQPSDDALAFVAEFGQSPESHGGEGMGEGEEEAKSLEDAPGETGPKREGRRRRSRRRVSRPQANVSHAALDETTDQGEKTAAIGESEAIAEEPESSWPLDSEAEDYRLGRVDQMPAAPVELVAQPQAAQPPAPTVAEPVAETVASSLEPERPKRTGWWQRAKAQLRG